MSGDPPRGLGCVERPSLGVGWGQDALRVDQEVWEALPVGLEGSGRPSDEPGGVRRTSRWAWRGPGPSQKAGRGWVALSNCR